jgi:3-deoxy-manno-octulosonate cytidylyltransferase (CMP-KDO synthetase)
VALPPGRLEQCERLEQLRLLEAGYRIGCVVVREVLHAVDVPADLRWVRRYWARQARRKL